MSEEEKKAMKYFYNLRATIDESNMLFDEDLNVKCGKETIKHITTLLNLIEKLQKENEELKFKERSRIIGKYGDVEIHDVINRTLSNDYISVKKIQDIIDRIDYDIKKIKEIISNNSNIYTSDRRNDYQIVRLRAMNTKSLDIKKRLQELIEERREK